MGERKSIVNSPAVEVLENVYTFGRFNGPSSIMDLSKPNILSLSEVISECPPFQVNLLLLFLTIPL